MANEKESLADKLKGKIRDLVWSNLYSRRIMAQTADLYTDKIFSVIIAMLGGKKPDEDAPSATPPEKDDLQGINKGPFNHS